MMAAPGMGPTLRLDDSITRQRVSPGTVRRVLPYAGRHRHWVVLALVATIVDAVIMAASPLMLKTVIDDGIRPGDFSVVVWLSVTIAVLAVVDAGAIYCQAWFSGRVGEGLVYELRTEVFTHVQRQPLAFFTRTQTGSLVSRLNTDIIGAQQAVTTLLTQAVSTFLTVGLVLAAMFYLSWQITLAALVLIPIFLVPARYFGRAMQRLAREEMQLDAEMGSMMNERFNVSGAMLVKLYGRPVEESDAFARRAARVRDIAVVSNVYARLFFILATLLTALTTALVYGFGGRLAIDGTLEIGALVAMVALLLRLYGPINQLSSIQASFMTALVSFDRVFEVLDLQPLIVEHPRAHDLPAAGDNGTSGLDLEFDDVWFRYPSAEEVSLASLESTGARVRESAQDDWTLRELSFTVPQGGMTALVGSSGAGKTTITNLVPRLYDPVRGAVRVGGHDLRELTLTSLRDTIGVVTQDAHLFHDTIRANLLYARPEATEAEVVAACEAARIQEVIDALPEGLDTVVGDRGHRLSGGEKQRVALARLLLKSPPIVVLDEATAHLDSESEAAIQQALETALKGRTSLVIAHRLSTIRDADQILVVDAGRIVERGTHHGLLAAGGIYADLYRTQFAERKDVPDPDLLPETSAPGPA
ncbi:ABC transporter ATP-binding protein [Embleya sp. NPDC050154]|uniref:ABC transporter ATP-binding protein n=1 Tax=Embleya sp. NPDC050154 TaxID=3363988 RepID=UPI00379098EE